MADPASPKRLIGRALTLQMMPARPDVSETDAVGRRARNLPRLSHQTAIDMLQKGVVLVVDACGVQFGGMIGDNLVGTAPIEYNDAESALNTTGLRFKLYRDHFGCR